MEKTKNTSPKKMPYVNMDSPDLKRELQKMDEIIKKIKFPITSVGK
ncbi:MAG: hypothetical protein U5N85_07065 [Arcicella sp.]|nr:hypothetical protein [Arcicella sp.]